MYQLHGHDWHQNTNWLTTEPLSTWFGVEVIAGDVVALHLEDNNLKGASAT
jgi:hypothetical protein